MEIDQQLFNAARRMDRDALTKLFDLYAPGLYKYALRLCGDPLLSDHIVGDTFAKLMDQLSRGKGPTINFRSYLFDITYHLIVDESRYTRCRCPLEMTELGGRDARSATLNLENQILFEKVLLALRNDLPPPQRHVLILRFLEGFNLQETAAILGINVNNVKVMQNRAIARLRSALVSRGMLPVEPGRTPAKTRKSPQPIAI